VSVALVVAPEETGTRLDRFLAARIPEVSRSRLRKWLDEGRVQIAGVAVRPSLPLQAGWTIQVERPADLPSELRPEAIPLSVLHEDEDLLVVDKPPGLTVHPGSGRETATLAHALLHRYPGVVWPGPPARPGIVHRLDRLTSGLLVVARSEIAYLDLQRQVGAHALDRRYIALVWGAPREPEGEIAAPIGRDPGERTRMMVARRGGREARTFYRTLRAFGEVSLLDLRLETGRTHQIRVHMQHAGFPVFGDPTYGGGRAFLARLAPARRTIWLARLRRLNRQALHAYHLGLRHPRDQRRWVFEAPPPEDLDGLLRDVVSAEQGEG
jgi:23S rRNA pseudouridine1911/1915/1917 synthase